MKKLHRPSVVAHTSILSTWEAELCEFQANLFYIVKFQANQGYTMRPCLKNKPKPKWTVLAKKYKRQWLLQIRIASSQSFLNVSLQLL